MNSFFKNLKYIAATSLIFTVPVLLTLSFCLNWGWATQGILCLVCLFDFITVLMLVIAFTDTLE